MSVTKTELKKQLVAERKKMREKQKNSLFLRKTANVFRAMENRAADMERAHEMDFDLSRFRNFAQSVLGIDCPYCGETKLTLAQIAFDHDIPVMRGGSFQITNLRACCKSCNWQKGVMRYDEFKELLELISSSTFAPIARTDIKRRLTIGGKWSFGK